MKDLRVEAVRGELADQVLAVGQLADVLRQVIGGESEDLRWGPELDAGLARVREQCGLDFSWFKRSTVARRVRRRAERLQVPVNTYLDGLDGPEVERLTQQLLIGVTRFFRDTDVWPRVSALLAEQAGPGGLRIWVPGCSTGEEAYTLAMLAQEALEVAGHGTAPLLVIASDVNSRSLAWARRGWYPASIVDEVGAARLGRSFEPEGSGWRARSELRDKMLFARHDLLQDPPFSRVNLVSCRNLLIYLSPEGQERASRAVRYALSPRGVLVLGCSEHLGASGPRFEKLEPGQPIYRRRETLADTPLRPTMSPPVREPPLRPPHSLAGMSVARPTGWS